MASTYLLAKLNSSTDAPNPSSPNTKAVLTALAALVPTEVIAAASTIDGYLTATNAAGQVSWAHENVARVLMFVLGALVIPLVYLLGADNTGVPSVRTVGLVAISIASFAGWLALQTPTVYDGWFGTNGQVGDTAVRAAILAVAVLVLGLFAGALGRTPPAAAAPPAAT
jgi:hypothetical protein